MGDETTHASDSRDLSQDLESLRSKVARLEAEVMQLRHVEAEVIQLRHEASSNWAALQVSAKELTDVEYTALEPNPKFSSDTQRYWEGWCPCCKKPLDLVSWRRHIPRQEEKAQEPKPSRYAYAAAIWGDGGGLSGFALGALVLGLSLSKKSSFDRVLMYTDDVPENSLTELAKLWKLVPVQRINAHPDLFTDAFEGHRFDGVFTKLHALSLVDYDKVLMMDIDLAILDCPDELFQLQAPAAMRRGNSENQHGERIHGRSFFGGQKYGWVQSGGINAGVMLFEPNRKDFDQMLIEVCAERHPERVPGNGPEQDYLSRYYASRWHHISLLYNFQTHQVLQSMESALKVLNGIDDFAWWLDAQESVEIAGESEIGLGTCLRCINTPASGKLPVFESPYSFHSVGAVVRHEIVEAVGRVVYVKKYKMVPVKVSGTSEGGEIDDIGFVDLSWFEVDASAASTTSSLHREGSIGNGTILKCAGLPPRHEQVGLPVFEGIDSWTHVGYVQLGETMVASGPRIALEHSIPMVPIKQPCTGFVDGRFVNVSEIPEHGDAAAGQVDQDNGHAGVSQSCCIGDCAAGAPAPSADEVSVWMPERLALDPKDVHIVHFSGAVKMWDRDYLNCETDHQFVDRLLKSNSGRSVKLWLERAGDISDYAEYGIRLKDQSFEALGNRERYLAHVRGQNAIEQLITQGVANTKEIAHRAARQWRIELEALPTSLGYSSLTELLDRLSRGPVFSHGDKVFVFWTADDIWYEGVIEGFDYHGNYLVKFDNFSECARIEYKYLRKFPPHEQ